MSDGGILLVDKPRGRTSFSLVPVLRKLTGFKTIGHAGTLDPFATGVLVMLLGRPFTRLAEKFLADDKEYTATLTLGASTDTFDCDGKIVARGEKIPSLDEIEVCLKKFQGTILQTPPMFSAKKVQGKKLYELARKGIAIERKPIPVTLTTHFVRYNYPFLELTIACSKGTYIRSLADEIGKELGCFAHLSTLTRTRSGSFRLDECHAWEKITAQGFDFRETLKR